MVPRETWKEVPGYPGYKVSNMGRVRGPRKMLKPRPDSGGTYQVCLYNSDGTKDVSVGRLVLMLFRGPPRPGYECCHRIGGRRWHALQNLYWGTRAENMRDMVRDGNSNKGKNFTPGELNSQSKLTWEKVKEIRSLGGTVRQRVLSEKFKVAQSCISKILNNKRWKQDDT